MNKPIIRSTLLFLFVVLFVWLILYAFYYIVAFGYPFLIALALAFIINPFVNFLNERLNVPRSLAVLLALLLGVAILVGLATLIIAEIISGATYLASILPATTQELTLFFQNQFNAIYNLIENKLENVDASIILTLQNNIGSLAQSVLESTQVIIRSLISNVAVFLALLPNIVTVFIFAVLATFFISKDWKKLKILTLRMLPERIQTSTKSVIKELFRALGGFIKAQATLISITGVFVLIGLSILQVKYALTLALIIAFVDLLPYLGTGFVFVPWIVYLFITGNTKLAIGLLILYGIILVARQFLEPKVLSSSIGLDPLATLIALFVGFKLFGLLGLIIGPILLVILKTLHTTGILKEVQNFILERD